MDPVPPNRPAGPDQGLWLTATAFLPPELLTSSPPGAAGFGQGGVLDHIRPGPGLATFAAEAAGGIGGTGVPAPPPVPVRGSASTPGTADEAERSTLADLSDDELTGLICAWRKLSSWAQAGELAAVAELVSRREAEARAAGNRDSVVADTATGEIGAAVTLTARSAQDLADRATTLTGLPATMAALAPPSPSRQAARRLAPRTTRAGRVRMGHPVRLEVLHRPSQLRSLTRVMATRQAIEVS